MPNIIEQQDLLKSLPDARLAMLLQKPVGDIPPFLVAAEAQRRQTIRQQYGGGAPRESVVDTLTKQLARVPQNIKPEMNTPPQIPPPQMGIAALPQSEPRQMAAGGVVRGYAGGGTVTGISPRVRMIADQFGITVDEAKQMLDANPDVGSSLPDDMAGVKAPEIPEVASQKSLDAIYDGPGAWTTGDYLRSIAGHALNGLPGGFLVSYFGELNDPQITNNRFKQSALDEKAKAEEKAAAAARTRMPPGTSSDPRMSKERVEQIISEAKSKGATPEQVDEIRKRLEALYAEQEPSDWEKAAKWFAASEQFLDPSKTTMQSLAGAGRAFAEAAGAESRAQREARIEGQKALLQYDMELANMKRKAEFDAAEEERKNKAFPIREQADGIGRRISQLQGELSKIDPMATDYEERSRALREAIAHEEAKLAYLAQKYGGEDYSGIRLFDGTDQLKGI